MRSTPKLYSELAPWWPLLSDPADYADEAAFVRQLLFETCDRAPRKLVEFGSGGGNNASHLKAHFQLRLVDRSPDMLAVSRALNPECEHVEGDMRTTRLGRLFDAAFVHENISPGTQHGGHDGAQRGMRYLEWTFDPDPTDTTYLVDFAYILHEEDKAPQMLSDRHVCGFFARADWLRLLREVGFQPRSLPDGCGHDIFVTLKPGC